ncbi:MAG TPA: trigger factor [Candidatus Paceibacterota bacterium]|nr:trigger factor [Candidatus Paceibacterota bacterium]
MTHTKKYTLIITNLPGGEIELAGNLPWDTFLTYEAAALAHLGKNIEVDGFRKGSVPETMVRKHIPDQLLLEEMAERALQEHYVQMLTQESIDAIGRPRIALTKLARDNDLEFKIITAVMPEVKLPDYHALAKAAEKIEAPAVTDEDVENTINELRHMRLHQNDTAGTHDHSTPHEHTEAELPVVDDAFAKSFGKFETVADLKAKIRENLALEKDREAKDKQRTAVLEAVSKETEVVVPKLFVEAELQKLVSQVEFEVSRAGVKFEDYLKQVGKTKEDLEKEFLPDAERRAKFQLVLDAIANKENLKPEAEVVEQETQKLMTMYPGADEARTRAYAQMVLTNEKVLSFLETL